MKKQLFQACIELTNRRWSSSLLKRFSTSKASKPMIPLFARTYQLNMNESAKKLTEFQSLHHLFTRQLKAGARPISLDKDAVVAPVDGRCAEQGLITKESGFVVKGQAYSLTEMLESEKEAKCFINGRYLIFYLSPSHYHRIHSPFDALCSYIKVAGGPSYPVNRLGLTYGKRPLSRNYRQINYLKTEYGRCAMVEVGAMNINTIVRTKKESEWRKGEEIGYFSFGSTVILLFEEGTFIPDFSSEEVRVGERIGKFGSHDKAL